MARINRDERGVIFVLFAIVLPVLVLAAAITVNYAGLYLTGSNTNYRGPLQEKLSMQVAADAAARSASMVQVLDGSTLSMVQSEARALAKANGYTHGDNGVVVEVNVPPKGGNYTAYHFNAVEVIISQPYNLLMGFMFGANTMNLSVRAVAAWAFAPCVVALNNTSQGQSGIDFGGTGTTASIPCGIYSNNPSPTASVTTSGGATVETYIVGMVGNTTASGISGIGSAPAIINGGMQPFIDPYSNLNLTPPANTPTITQQTKDLPVNLSPGIYNNGITGSHTLAAGTYYFPKNASFTLSGGDTIDATAGVTLVFSEDSAGFGATSSNVVIDLNAPSSGPFAGIAIASRSTSNSPQGFNATGLTANINGVMYAPYSLLNYNAKVTNGQNCLTIVADAIKINGGPSLGKACPSASMNGSGFRAAGLVE